MFSIWALPGFLGLPADWDFLEWGNLRGVGLDSLPWTSLSDWPERFHQWLDAQKGDKEILMGYSMGGRLALHSLMHAPQRWKGAVLISTHPGLIDIEARLERQREDDEWARRFEQEEWTSLMHDWNRRAVFAEDRFRFNRREQDYDRHWLAHLMREGSLAKQQDFRLRIAALPIPLLWITGAADQHYCKLAESLTFHHPDSCRVKIEQAGHRVPWEQPEQFSEYIFAFLQKINCE